MSNCPCTGDPIEYYRCILAQHLGLFDLLFISFLEPGQLCFTPIPITGCVTRKQPNIQHLERVSKFSFRLTNRDARLGSIPRRGIRNSALGCPAGLPRVSVRKWLNSERVASLFEPDVRPVSRMDSTLSELGQLECDVPR